MYRFIYDPGHAWLEVPFNELRELGVKPSCYSFYNPLRNMAYLEEDCDLGKFANAWEAKHGVKLDKTQVESIYQENTFVRALPRFK